MWVLRSNVWNKTKIYLLCNHTSFLIYLWYRCINTDNNDVLFKGVKDVTMSLLYTTILYKRLLHTIMLTKYNRVRFPAGAGNFSLHHRVQNGSGVHPANECQGLFPWGWSGRGVKLTTHLHLGPRSRMRGSIPPPRYTFMTWCLVKHRDNFTFSFTLIGRTNEAFFLSDVPFYVVMLARKC
jgi:hypothetical protein